MFSTSQPTDLPLGRSEIDKYAQLRTQPDWLEHLLKLGNTQVVHAHQDRVATSSDHSKLMYTLLTEAELARTAAGTSNLRKEGIDGVAAVQDRKRGCMWVYLGRAQQRHYVARLDLAEQPAQLTDGYVWQQVRSVGAQLPGLEAGLAVTTLAVEKWHSTHLHCTYCGAPTAIIEAGWAQRCTAEHRSLFPRVEPAVIMTVHDQDDRVLLGHNPAWPAGRYSTLAGFVEAGESLEHAVRREVFEEAGVIVDEVRYLGSQAWPYPASLMLGFQAKARTTKVELIDEEISDARWWSRQELIQDVTAGTLALPSRTSIARWLIETWYGEELPDTADWR